MGSTKKIDKSLSFRNFSPFYERALAESKRGENILKLIEKDIDKRKMVAYSQLSAEQRIVEKDLYALRMTQKRIWEDRKKRNRRAFSDSGLDEMERGRLERRFTNTSEIVDGNKCPRIRRVSSILPQLTENINTVTSKTFVPRRKTSSQSSVPTWDNRSALTRSSKLLTRRSVSAPTFVTESGIPNVASSFKPFTDSNTAFDGQF